jgi:hypothetical protein
MLPVRLTRRVRRNCPVLPHQGGSFSRVQDRRKRGRFELFRGWEVFGGMQSVFSGFGYGSGREEYLKSAEGERRLNSL